MFKFIACSDLHITRIKPSSRKDIYFSSIKRKISWLFKTANDNNAHIVCGGDVFENVSVSHGTIKDIIKIALQYPNVKFFTVFGQHDLRYHVYTSNENTPLAILLAALNAHHLDEQVFENDEVCIKGASWGKPIPEVTEGKVNILATHRMVTEAPLWPGHIDFTTPEQLLALGYDVVVSGDNHKSFVYENNSKFVINSGSLVRSKIDQYKYLPKVFLVEIARDKATCTPLNVPVRNAASVFKEEKIKEYDLKLEKAKNQLDTFTQNLDNYTLEKPDFMFNLEQIKDASEDAMVVMCFNNIIERVVNRK